MNTYLIFFLNKIEEFKKKILNLLHFPARKCRPTWTNQFGKLLFCIGKDYFLNGQRFPGNNDAGESP